MLIENDYLTATAIPAGCKPHTLTPVAVMVMVMMMAFRRWRRRLLIFVVLVVRVRLCPMRRNRWLVIGRLFQVLVVRRRKSNAREDRKKCFNIRTTINIRIHRPVISQGFFNRIYNIE